MARLSWNVSSGGRSQTSCWRLPSTRAMRRLNAGPPVHGTNPATSTRPVVGWSRPVSIFSVVVFPAPLGPRNPTISPGSMRNVTSRTACTSRYRGRTSARSAPPSPGSRTLTRNVLLSRSAVMPDAIRPGNLSGKNVGAQHAAPLRRLRQSCSVLPVGLLLVGLRLARRFARRRALPLGLPELMVGRALRVRCLGRGKAEALERRADILAAIQAVEHGLSRDAGVLRAEMLGEQVRRDELAARELRVRLPRLVVRALERVRRGVQLLGDCGEALLCLRRLISARALSGGVGCRSLRMTCAPLS